MKTGDYRTAYRGKQSGFTLLELLVVIAIIGVLSSIALASLADAREGARDTSRITMLREMRTAMQLYYTEFGEYPEPRNPGPAAGISFTGGLRGELAPTVQHTDLLRFYPTPPVDPLDPATGYFYLRNNDGDGYAIVLFLESNDGVYCSDRVDVTAGLVSDAGFSSIPDCR
ncbi:MAG TPA: type II secretion system protein [Candidatus Paceibacterota bacterium]|nr:type II secretion system protein [Candidatus Paceibacterota bacterium]